MWEVEALGHMGKGSAGQYKEILQYIQHELPMIRRMSAWGL